jgi:hypothetical protein
VYLWAEEVPAKTMSSALFLSAMLSSRAPLYSRFVPIFDFLIQRRGLEEVIHPMNMTLRDTDVELKGHSLVGKRILLGVAGGIAAVDTVRLCREFRRHGAELTVVMTPSAQILIAIWKHSIIWMQWSLLQQPDISWLRLFMVYNTGPC